MSKLAEIKDLIERGINQFIAICTNANRDLPFHDYYDTDGYADTGHYVVGANQNIRDGDQKKFFVSKSTLLRSTTDTTIRFNNQNNIPVYLAANTYFEFKSNIHELFWDITQREGDIFMWFEGVMYNEGRRPH